MDDGADIRVGNSKPNPKLCLCAGSAVAGLIIGSAKCYCEHVSPHLTISATYQAH